MATTNDRAVIDLGRLKTFKSMLDASIGSVDAINVIAPKTVDTKKAASAAYYNSLAIGEGAKCPSDKYTQIAIGPYSKTQGANAISFGLAAEADGNVSLSMGIYTHSEGDYSFAIGTASAVNGEGSKALGYFAQSIGKYTDTLSSNSYCIGNRSQALGEQSSTCASQSAAIGTAATVNGASVPDPAVKDFKASTMNSVALGSFSVADEENTISVGNDVASITKYHRNVDESTGELTETAPFWEKRTVNLPASGQHLKRRITNVADPIDGHNAATKNYVDNIKTHILFIDNFDVTLTSQQLEAIGKHWPNVIICSGNSSAAFSPIDRRIDPSNNKPLSFVFANAMYTDSGNSNIVVGTNNDNYLVLQLNIDAATGTIEPNYHVSLFPLIATNPRFSDASTVKAIGDNSIAAGNGANASMNNSIAIGSNSKASESSSVAIGTISAANGSGSIAIGIGSSTNKTDSHSVALGASSTTTKSNQVSIGNNAAGITRYLSNVKDPVEDQDAATRYWVKNADRSDVFTTDTSLDTYGGSGLYVLEANSDLKWVSVRGYTNWKTFGEIWSKMVHLPGSTDGWWIKTDMKVPDAMIPETNFISDTHGLEFYSTYAMPQRTYSVSLAVGTDGFIYIGKWESEAYGSEPHGIYLDGHRFYL